MNKFYRIGIMLLVFFALSTAAAIAEETAKQPEKTSGFVCPVLGGKAGEEHGNSSPKLIQEIGGGDYTVVGPGVKVPVHATNDEGRGTPKGDHAAPGDTTYTAIWAGQ
jgi:hypothetical protein